MTANVTIQFFTYVLRNDGYLNYIYLFIVAEESTKVAYGFMSFQSWKNLTIRFFSRSGIVCWWCLLGSWPWPDPRASSWNSANGCPAVRARRTLSWESSPPSWRSSSRYSRHSDHTRTRPRGRYSTGSIGWSETPRTYSPVSIRPFSSKTQTSNDPQRHRRPGLRLQTRLRLMSRGRI